MSFIKIMFQAIGYGYLYDYPYFQYLFQAGIVIALQVPACSIPIGPLHIFSSFGSFFLLMVLIVRNKTL